MGIFFTRKVEVIDKPRKRIGCLGKTLIALVVYFALCGLAGWWYDNSVSVVSLSDNTVYKLPLKGVLVEQAPEDDPFAELMGALPYGRESENRVGLDRLLSNIRLAKENDKIKGIYLYDGRLGMAPASAKTLRDALLDFKQSGKFIVAYAEHYGQLNYYVASVADRIYLNPTGEVDWNGLGSQKAYYKRILDKLGIEMQILKVGTFKSAVEPFIRTSMSEADRAQTKVYLHGLWSEIRGAVSESRGISIEELDKLADRYMGLQPQDDYIACGMVDSLCYRDGMDSVLTRLAGEDYHTVNTNELAMAKRSKQKGKDKIAVVYASGEITDESGDGIVGSKMVKTLKQVGKDDDVKAVVLRVNSPGGSANASEHIHHAVQLLREKGVPVVVSMGDYAASGGYYISCGADYIYAEPTTLTGSIGIFGMIPSVKGLREKVGYDIDGVATHHLSLLESDILYQGMNDEEHRLMQTMVERGYDLFTGRCAEGRHMPQDSIKRIGEGRVWLGKDALRLGLVDEMGNLNDAVEKAAKMAGTEDYRLAYFPEPKDFLTQLMEKMDNSSEEERMLLKLKELCSKPQMMAIEYFGTIQ